MNIGLTIAGGMAKGAYELGALEALSQLIPLEQFSYVSCASVGTINGYCFCTGQLDLGRRLWEGMCAPGEKLFITQVLRDQRLQDSLTAMVETRLPLRTNLSTTLYNASRRTLVYKNLAAVDPALLRSYLQASVAMPIYNKAVSIGEEAFYDGAMIDNIPVFPLTEHELDYVICIYFDREVYRFETPEFDSRVIKLTFPVVNMVRQSVVFRKESVEEMLRVGREHALEALAPYFRNGWEDKDTVLAAIEEANQAGRTHPFRITGDLIVTNLNKVTSKFAKRKIEI